MVIRRTVEQGNSSVKEENWYSRVGSLKGFGNAILPQVAAEVMGAYLDATPRWHGEAF